MEFGFTLYKCQKCTERVNCDKCQKELEEQLLQEREIRSAELQMGPKRILLDSALEPDDLRELLEDYGIFVS